MAKKHLDIIRKDHHDVFMRTTLTLDPDVAQRLETEISRSGDGMKAVVNRALRIGLGMTDKPVEPEPFQVEPHDFGVRAGLDLDRMNQLVDELEGEQSAWKLTSAQTGGWAGGIGSVKKPPIDEPSSRKDR